MKGPSSNWVQMFPGITRHRIALTEDMYQMEVILEAGSEVPLHQHPHEQISYVVQGHLRFQIGSTVIEAPAGSSLSIPGNTRHAVWAIEASLVVDTFSPPREDYLSIDVD